MSLLSPQFLDELRARTTLSTLIGRTTKLVRAGREFKACCPFHQEKTPSFWVNDEKGFYHCFGCSAHGDAIRWLTESQGLGFMDAVKELAAAAGMDLPAPDPATRERAERAAGLHDVMAAAERWFQGELSGLSGGETRAYLDRRGITAATAAAFGLGFAPDGRTRLKTALADIPGPMLVEGGLLIEVEGRDTYDRFRNRLMIPIRDPRGRTIAFGGRIIGDGEPKYLNSPETPLFDKGRTLYNLDRAAPAARKAGRILVVEGYLDVIGLAQGGIAEAVAPLGTALTEAQMALLWRVTDVPVLCFDGDKAGANAAIRAAERALPVLQLGKSLRFATLPAGKDPDDLIREGGKAAFEAAIARPESLVEILYRAASADVNPASPDDRAALRARLNTLADSCTDKLVADEYRRSFTAMFFDAHGWKREDRRTVAQAVIRTGPRGRAALAHSSLRSLLYGLTRFPGVAADRIEAIAALSVVQPDLARWRDMLVNHAVTHGPDEDGIAAILESETLREVTARDLRFDLRFPFCDDRVDRAFATERLIALLELLNEERVLDDELTRLNAAAIADSGLGRYDSIEAGRARIREQKLKLLDRSFELGSAETVFADTATKASGGQ